MATLHRPEIASLVEIVSKQNGIDNSQITKVTRNDKGEGYMGEICMVTVRDANTKKELDLVVKAAFNDENIREAMPVRKAFENEILFYRDVIPTYEKLLSETTNNKIEFIPKCLKVSVEDQQEMLVLENLKSQGFDTFEKNMCFDDDHVSLIFKTYGKFHALSYVLLDQNPEKFEDLTKRICNLFFEFMQDNKAFSTLTADTARDVEKYLIPGEDDVIIEKYQKYVGERVLDVLRKLNNDDVDCPAITHGDCWSNNMLFRYKETPNGRKVSEIRLIDFQIPRKTSPVFDLSYCLYSGASTKVLDNLNQHLETYHEHFSKCVRELGSNPEKLFPFSKLKEHWKKYSRFGMIMASCVWRVKLAKTAEKFDLTDAGNAEGMSDLFYNIKFDEEEYANVIRGLLWHLSDIDAL